MDFLPQFFHFSSSPAAILPMPVFFEDIDDVSVVSETSCGVGGIEPSPELTVEDEGESVGLDS